jgi:hypothetical protein
MTARIMKLPCTVAGRELLREATILIGGWGKAAGAELEEFDWDGSAEKRRRLGVSVEPQKGAC